MWSILGFVMEKRTYQEEAYKYFPLLSQMKVFVFWPAHCSLREEAVEINSLEETHHLLFGTENLGFRCENVDVIIQQEKGRLL